MTYIAIATLAVGLFTGDWLIAACVATLALPWLLLRSNEGPPVVSLAITLQWVAVAIGVFYVYFTGRPLEATLRSDYRPMVLIGLGCVTSLTLGLFAGSRLIERRWAPTGTRPDHAFQVPTLLACYPVAVVLVGILQRIAPDYPSIRQVLVAFTYIKIGFVYLLLRHFVRESQWGRLAVLLAVETVLGITGFFAGFREPLIMAILAMLEYFDHRSIRQWATIGVLVSVLGALGLIWISIRGDYRERYLSDTTFSESRSKRVDMLGALASDYVSHASADNFADVDNLVDRVWAIYYPALAVARVPSVLPHTDGQMLTDAVTHALSPRVFFPDKAALISGSELVRKYTGLYVAGDEANTTIAFGYAAESYIDFGIPMMFVPVAVFGFLMGVAYTSLLRLLRHRDIAVAIVTVICWMSLDSFERSWAKTLGDAGTLLVYLGGISYVLDRLWFEKFKTLYGADASPVGEMVGDAPSLQLQPHSK